MHDACRVKADGSGSFDLISPYFERLAKSGTIIEKVFSRPSLAHMAGSVSCTIRRLCLGNQCGCIAYSLGSDIRYLSPFVCEHERMLYRLLEEASVTIKC